MPFSIKIFFLFYFTDRLIQEAPFPTGTQFPSLEDATTRQLIDSFARKEIEPVLEWLRENAPEEEALIFDLQKQQFIKFIQEGNIDR